MLAYTLSAYDRLLCFTQTVAYLIAALPLRIIFKVTRKFQNDITKTGSGFLIVANHQSEADPFLLLACLPFQSFLKLLPIYFPTTEAIFSSPKYNPKFFPFIWLLGCFSIGKNNAERMHTLFYIRQLLEQKRTVVIFPEGKINKDINLDDFKRGTDFFITKSAGVIFVRLSGVSTSVRHKGQTNCIVSFSKIFSPDEINLQTLNAKEIISNL